MPRGLSRSLGGYIHWDSNDGQSRRTLVADNEPARSTYSYSIVGLAAATGATDLAVLELPANATNTLIRLRQLQISGTAGSSSQYALNVLRRSGLNTGGTRTTPTPIPRDPRLDPAVGVLGFYTVNPGALGPLVGPFDGGRLTLAAPGGNNLDRLNLQFSWLNDMSPILREPGTCFAINMVGLPAGCAVDISMTWVEEELLPTGA